MKRKKYVKSAERKTVGDDEKVIIRKLRDRQMLMEMNHLELKDLSE